MPSSSLPPVLEYMKATEVTRSGEKIFVKSMLCWLFGSSVRKIGPLRTIIQPTRNRKSPQITESKTVQGTTLFCFYISLAVKALEADYSVLFTTLSSLAEDVTGVPHPSLRRQRLRRYLSPRVLVIDEIGYTKLSGDQSNAFFELVRDRYEKGPILLTSNTSFSEWGSLLNDEVLATALLDRLLHHAEVISISGKSFRMKDRLVTGKSKAATPKQG